MPPFETHSRAEVPLSQNSGSQDSTSPLFETAYSLGRETKMIGLGVGEAILDTVKHPLDKLPELGVAFGTGTVLGAIGRSGAPGRLIAGGIGIAMAVKLGYDEITGNRWSQFGSAVADTWHSGTNMDKNIAATRNSLGSFVVDMGIGYAGMKAGGFAVSRFAPRAFEPAKLIEQAEPKVEVTKGIAPRFSFDALKATMAEAGVSEEGIAASVKTENFLGRGGNAAVYKIDGVKDFVLRVPGPPGKGVQGLSPIEAVADIFPEGNVGQPVAKMGNATILKVQDGTPAGGPLGRDARAMGETAARKIYGSSIEKAADMPQSAYDEFAAMLMNLQKKGLQFDPSKANNVLIDSAGKRFNLVDITTRSPNSTYNHSLSDMVVTLMDNGFINTLGDRGKLWQGQYQTILSKAVLAAERAGLPLELGGSSLRYSFQLADATTFWSGLVAKHGQQHLAPLAPLVRSE